MCKMTSLRAALGGRLIDVEAHGVQHCFSPSGSLWAHEGAFGASLALAVSLEVLPGHMKNVTNNHENAYAVECLFDGLSQVIVWICY